MSVTENINNLNKPETSREKSRDICEYFETLRRNYDEQLLREIIDHKMHTAQEIAERIVILTMLFYVRNTTNEECRKMYSEIKKNYWSKASPEEQNIIESQAFTYDEDLAAGMYPGIIAMLLWTLYKIDDLHLLDQTQYRLEFLQALKDIIDNPEEILRTAHKRPTAEILDTLLHTCKQYTELKIAFNAIEPMLDDSLFLRTTERYMALLWVIDECTWDVALYETFEEAFMTRASDSLQVDEEKEANFDQSEPDLGVLGDDPEIQKGSSNSYL